MAVSDFISPLEAIPLSLVYLVSDSLEWYTVGMVGLILCKLGTFLRRVSASVSLESLVWIAVDRFVAVVLPMKGRLISSKVRAFAIASTWITAIVINSIDLYMYDLVEKHQTLRCSYSPVYWYTLIYVLRVALFCIAPLFAMTILYCMIAMTLWKQDKALHFAANNKADHKLDVRLKWAYLLWLRSIFALFQCLFWTSSWEWESKCRVCLSSCWFFSVILCFIFLPQSTQLFALHLFEVTGVDS